MSFKIKRIVMKPNTYPKFWSSSDTVIDIPEDNGLPTVANADDDTSTSNLNKLVEEEEEDNSTSN
jgi:hypothetical protein